MILKKQVYKNSRIIAKIGQKKKWGHKDYRIITNLGKRSTLKKSRINAEDRPFKKHA